MNNNTKAANIMTWAKFKKKFNPTIYSTHDSIFGTKSIISPTMKNFGLNEEIIYDIEDGVKPLIIVKEHMDVFKYSYIVYHKWKYRDGSGFGISIYYK